MPMLTTTTDDAFLPLVTRSNSGGGEHDFGEESEERSGAFHPERVQKMMVHQNSMTALETTMSSLSVSKKPILTASNDIVSEVIAQWEALCHREKDAAYTTACDGKLDFVEYQREKISSFYFSVIDEKNLDRRIVSIALSYLKSFLARQPDEAPNARFYQLVMITSVYLAIKVHSSNIYKDGRPIIFIKEVANWSDGVFSTQDISEMETRMLSTLNYKMNPPVPLNFLDILKPVLDADLLLIPQVKQHIITISNWLCDVSVVDSYFSGVNPSSVAYAAILVAVDTSSIGTLKCVESQCLQHDESITLECYERMVEMYYEMDEGPYEHSVDRCRSPTEVLVRVV